MNIFGHIKSALAVGLSRSEPLLIDLGSSQTRIFTIDTNTGKSREIFNQATCLAVHTTSQSVVAFGDKAFHLLGKTPSSIEVNFPVLYGTVAHSKYLELFLISVVENVLPEIKLQRHIFGMFVKVAVPSSISPAKKAMLKQVLKSVGFTKIEFISSGYALVTNISQNGGKMRDICTLDIGAQKTEISVFSLGELIYSKSYKWGGIYLTEYLQKIIRGKHQCVVGWHIAEAAKKEIGTVIPSKSKLAIRGKDLVTQASKTVILDSSDIKVEFSKNLENLLDDLQQFFSLLPSEIAVSVLDKGIFLTGGTSQLKGIDQAIIKKFKCDVLLSSKPTMDIVTGLQKL